MPPPTPSSAPPAAAASPRRLPSRRVSALVSHFESTAAPLHPARPSSTSAPSCPRAGAPHRITTSETSRARSSVVDERDDRREGYLRDDTAASTVPGRAAAAVPAPSVIVVDVGKTNEAPVSPSSAAARSSTAPPHPQSSSAGLLAALSGGKAAAAASIVVPASVSSARDGRPILTVARPASHPFAARDAAAAQARARICAVEGPARLGEEDVAPLAPAPNSPISSLGAGSHLTPPRVPSAPPQNASASPTSRPPLEPRRSSVAWAELVPPERDSFDLEFDSASILSSMSAAPLIPPPSSSTRPPYPRASSSASSPPTAPTSRFTTTSTSTTSTRCVHAYELFARDAEPLVLPELDAVIEALGGAAHFTPMPGPSALRQSAQSPRAGTVAGGKGEEWELETLKRRKAVEEADEVFGSELEREGWDEWVRGEPPSRWRRFVAPMQRIFSSLARRRPLHGRVEADPHGAAARAAGMSRDEYIRSLKFPPFHLLAHKLTVTDLKANVRRPPPLIGVQGLLGAASSGILGAASSSMGLKLTSIEGLRDLMQIVTLLVTAASPTLGDAESSTLRTLFVTVPSVLSLDFVSAFGQALALLLVLTLVTLYTLYEFYRLSGGWHGPAGKLGRGELDLGEGFDRHLSSNVNVVPLSFLVRDLTLRSE